MHDIPRVAATQFGVFTVGQALRTGWTSHALRHAVGQGQLDRIQPGVYALSTEPALDRFAEQAVRLQQAAAATQLRNRRAPISHASAAALYGMTLVDLPALPCATYPRGHRGEIRGVHLHRAEIFDRHAVRLQRIMLTSPARTVIDLGREGGLDRCVVAADSAVRLGLTDDAELRAVLDRCSGWPGVRAARRAVTLLDPFAESALESLSRVRIHQAGLPAPLTQAEFSDRSGRVRARCDFYWPEFGVVGEADGIGKYGQGGVNDTMAALRREKIRQGLLEDLGLIVVRWGWRDLEPFAATATRLSSAFARGIRPDRAPRLWRTVPMRPWYRPSAAS